MCPRAEISPEQAKKIEEWAIGKKEVGLLTLRKGFRITPNQESKLQTRTSMVNGEPITIYQNIDYEMPSYKVLSEKHTLFVGPTLAKEIEKAGIMKFPEDEPEK
jgi:hypothetical protein